ncbi:MAG: anaerobic ribonucleoside-triphosphate reductase [Victivallaceae bacterium]|nr:anaerobic ribonucleoside-triphosphate reductase [Victivallaceae bacterium]
MAKCGAKCEIWSRPCGYFRPVTNWNIGKKQEFKDRKNYQIPKLNTKPALREGEK